MQAQLPHCHRREGAERAAASGRARPKHKASKAAAGKTAVVRLLGGGPCQHQWQRTLQKLCEITEKKGQGFSASYRQCGPGQMKGGGGRGEGHSMQTGARREGEKPEPPVALRRADGCARRGQYYKSKGQG